MRIKNLLQAKCENTRKGYAFSTYSRHKSAMQIQQINHPSISTAQGSQLVSPLPPAPDHSPLKETMRSVTPNS